ncbi:MAG: DUF2079 domain-containing protein [Bacteroidia bacterium]
MLKKINRVIESKHKLAIWATLAFFLIIYSSLSLINHYNFRTETLDLGLSNNAMWDYANGKFNYDECLDDKGQNFLRTHFDLYIPLFSPLSLLFKSYTLLIIQILAILFGAFGAYRLALHFELSKQSSLIVLLAYLSHFTVFTSLSFDYHSNVVASMLLPWYFLFHFKAKSKMMWLILFLVLVSKENMGF